MSGHSLEADILISRLSHRPDHLLKAMITIAESPKPRAMARCSRVSSIGTLDRFPCEVMHMILGMLDVQSIGRLAGVSFRGDTLVRSLPSYQDIMDFAPQSLVALGRTGLIGLHSLAELYATLRSERCTYCLDYGAFLFLPTCERCCWQCLRETPSLRVLPPKDVRKYFGLSQRHLQRLPILNSIPGKYGIMANVASEPCSLVSVRAARELALAVHGSADNMEKSLKRRCKNSITVITGRYLQAEPLVSPVQDPMLLPCQGNRPVDKFFGMASIPFPSRQILHEIEYGLWCQGCQVTLERYERMRLPRDVIKAAAPPDCSPYVVLFGMARRARSRSSFLDHVKHCCYGALQLVPELATVSD